MYLQLFFVECLVVWCVLPRVCEFYECERYTVNRSFVFAVASNATTKTK